jgi:hypothetical protein
METENEQTDLNKIGIGTKETQTLSAKPIVVQGHRIDDVYKDKEKTEKIGKKLVLISKHPDREDPIEISQVKYLKGEKITASGLWFNLDADKLIPKQSALAETMRKYSCKTLEDFDGKEIQTILDGKYLVIKAY